MQGVNYQTRAQDICLLLLCHFQILFESSSAQIFHLHSYYTPHRYIRKVNKHNCAKSWIISSLLGHHSILCSNYELCNAHRFIVYDHLIVTWKNNCLQSIIIFRKFMRIAPQIRYSHLERLSNNSYVKNQWPLFWSHVYSNLIISYYNLHFIIPVL